MSELSMPRGNWGIARLGDLLDILDSQRVPVNSAERAKRQGSVPYYGATGQVGWIDGHLFDEELVLLGEDGAPFLEADRPKAYVIRGKSWVNNHAHVLRALGGTPSLLWKYQLDQSDYHPFVSGTTRLKLSQAPMRRIPLLVPPLSEQRRIVDAIESYFTRFDDAVATLERVQRNLRRYRASVLKAAVEGRLVPTEAELARAEGRDYEPASVLLERILAERRRRWESSERRGKYEEPIAPSVLPELPNGWCWATVGQLGFITSGQTPSGITECLSAAGDVPWFRVGDMNTEGNETYMRHAKDWLCQGDIERLRLHVRPGGTIIFPKRGGAIATNKKRRLLRPSVYDLNTMGVVPVEPVSAYLWLWFLKLDLGSLSDGSNVPQINHGDIWPLPVPLPPLAEQRRITGEVDRQLSVSEGANAVIASNQNRCQRLRQSILKWAFEGKLADQDPTDEAASVLLERIRAERAAATPAKEARHTNRRARMTA